MFPSSSHSTNTNSSGSDDNFQSLNRMVTMTGHTNNPAEQQPQHQQPQPSPFGDNNNNLSSNTSAVASTTTMSVGSTSDHPADVKQQLYSPTPRELAYVIFILEKVFPASYSLYNNSHHQQISINGKDAVTFLTTSGIHRLILRILWTVVDPHNEGTLVNIAQLHTIVRMVALTQAGHVEPELLAVGTLPPPKPTPVQVLWKILDKTAKLVVPLAKFDAVAIPDQQQLQQIYMLHQRVAQQQQQPQPQQSMSLVPTWQQQQQPQQQGMAAFDALGGVQDQPLPSLGPPQSQPQSSSTSFPTMGSSFPGTGSLSSAVNAFGGFINKAVESLQQPHHHQQQQQPSSEGGSGLEHLAAFDSTTNTNNANNPSLGPALVSTGEFDPEDDDDEFGGFNNAILTQPSQQQQPPQPTTNDVFGGFTNATAPQPTGMAALDALGPVTDAPLPPLGGGMQQEQQPPEQSTMQETRDEFGGFEAAAVAAAPPSSDGVTGMNALDALGPVGNAPLQPLGEAPANTANKDTSSGNNTGANEFGGFINVVTPPPEPEGIGMAALNAMGGATAADAPLPPLDGAGGEQSSAPMGNTNVTNNDLDFGGFTDAPSQQPEITGLSALDALGPTENAPLPALGGLTSNDQSPSAAPATTTEGGVDDDDDDGFGGFTTVAPETEATGIAALDVLGGVMDTPLPPLGGQRQEGQIPVTTKVTGAAEEDDDEFGGFEDAAPQVSQQAQVAESCALDALGSTENAPLPSFGGIGQAQEQVAPEVTSEEDEFGGFTDAPAQTTQESATNETEDEFGGFNAPQQAARDSVDGKSAFDALTGVHDAPLPALGGFGQPQSERGLGTTSMLSVPPSVQPSLSFPGATSNGPDEASGMAAFDTIGPVQDAPLSGLTTKSEGTASLADSNDLGEVGDPSDTSFSSFNQAEGSHRRRFSGSLRRRSSRTLVSPETVPKDLMPSMPGERYVDHVRQNSLRKLPEFAAGDGSDAEESADNDSEDPFAGLDPAQGSATLEGYSKPLVLHEAAALSPGSEKAPQDLEPHAPGEHYVPHSKNATQTPGGLQTLEDDDEEDEFGGFEEAPKALPTVPTSNPASEPDPFSTTMPHELIPHAPGQHYVPHGAHVRKTPGGLSTVGEMTDAVSESMVDVQPDLALNPPTMLSRQETPMPQDLKPHMPGDRYVPHSAADSSTPGGLTTVGESLDEVKADPFGDFNDATPAVPSPVQLSRQATPAAQDLEPMARKMNVVNSGTIHEDDEVDDDDFGNFTGSTSTDQPGQVDIAPPTQMKHQATPRPQDLRPDPPSATQSFRPDPPGQGESLAFQESIQEGKEKDSDSSSTTSPDPFTAFDALAAPQPALPPLSSFSAGLSADNDSSAATPVSLSRQATPAVQDLQPTSQKAIVSESAPIKEGGEDNDDDFGDFLGGGTNHPAAPTLVEKESLELFAPSAPLSRSTSSDLSRLGSRSTRSLLDDDDDDEGERQHRCASPPPEVLYKNRQTTPVISESSAEEDDEFGDFEAFAGPEEVPPPAKISRQATPAVQDLQPVDKKMNISDSATIHEDEEDDEFGGFAEASAGKSAVAPAPSQLTRQATPAVQDLDPLRQKASAVPASSAAIQEEEEDDDFGDFTGSASANMPGQMELIPPTQMKRQATPLPKDLRPGFGAQKPDSPGLGVIGEALGEVAPEPSNTGADTPPPELARQATPAVQDLKPLTQKSSASELVGTAIMEEEDDFGDFGSFEQAGGSVPGAMEVHDPQSAMKPKQPHGQGLEGEGDDDFGDFGSFEQAGDPKNDFGVFASSQSQPVNTETANDDFGDFTAFPATASPAPAIDSPPGDDSGDWDAFQDASKVNDMPVGNSVSQLREKVISLSQQLPASFRESLDCGRAFDAMIGAEESITSEIQKRAERCIDMLSLLSSSHSKLASEYWMQVLAVARDELTLGNRLLDQASELSSQEQKITQKPLENMVAGMGEYLRATRSIVASVGDMMLLSLSTPFNEAALDSSWGSMPLIQRALEVEKLWRNMMDKSSRLGLARTKKLETMVEIRTKCYSRLPSTTLCQLSLQPLSEEDNHTTKASVDWKGRTFMACSANLLANKCPFYVSD